MSGIKVAKVFKKGRERTWDATLKEPVPRLIRIECLTKIGHKNRRPASIALLS